MLTEEAADMFNLMGKAHYGANRNQGYDDLFASGGAFEKQCQYLERLFPEGCPTFNKHGRKLAGGKF
jgi:hypothetical protein